MAGGGVQYSARCGACNVCHKHGIPVVETIAGRANLLADDPLNMRPDRRHGLGQRQCTRRGRCGAGRRHPAAGFYHRLMDRFSPDRPGSSVNAGRFDADQASSLAVVGDAKLAFGAVEHGIGGYKRPANWTAPGRKPTPCLERLCRCQHQPRQWQPPDVLCAGHRRGERALRIRATGSCRRRRASRRSHRQLAHQVARHRGCRIRLFLHGL
jgi:hypothetical protein